MGSNLANVNHNIFLTYCHEIVGIAMKWLVQEHFPTSTIGEAQNFQKTLSDLPKKDYDLVVLDAEIGDSTHVLGTVKYIRSISPQTRILIFSEMDETVYGPKYLAFGTNGYLAKNAHVDHIVLAIETALNGGVFYGGSTEQPNRDLNPEPVKPSILDQLSHREFEIAQLLVKGRSLTAISRMTQLKETTISTYKKRIFNKVGVKSLSDLIAVWEICR